MAGIMDRIMSFARSPKGRRVIEQGKRAAADPRKRAQAKETLRKFRSRH